MCEDRRPVVLLDVDGVLNPQWRQTANGTVAEIRPDHRDAARALGALGEIVWATTTTPTLLRALEDAIGWTKPLRAVPIVSLVGSAWTPKLVPVQRWIARQAASAELPALVVWLDDRLGPDAVVWATSMTEPPVHLVRVIASTGLRETHVEAVRRLTGSDRQ